MAASSLEAGRLTYFIRIGNEQKRRKSQDVSCGRSNRLRRCASGRISAVESNDTDAAKHGNVLRFFRRADAVLAADGLRRLEHHRFHVSDGFVEAA